MRLVAFVFVGLTLALPAQAQVTRQGTPRYCDYAGRTEDEGCPIHVDIRTGDREIIVLADGLWSQRYPPRQEIAVIDATTLAAVQGPDITRALQQVVGVTLTRNGGLGSFTGLSIRGSASERVLVLLDGARLNDVAAPAGGLDFSSVMSGGIERVELLRGSGSLVWGSDALGGVVHLTTSLADGAQASAEYGGDGQFAGTVALGERDNGHSFGISGGYVTRHGFSSAAAGQEADGFSQLSLSARGDVQVGDNWKAFASARHASGKADIDGFPAPLYLLADTAERQDMRQTTARGGLEFYDGQNTAFIALARSETGRDLLDGSASRQPSYATKGQSTRAEARGRLFVADGLAVLGGADWEWSNFGDGFTRASTAIGSAHAMAEWTPAWQTSLQAGARIDRHREFGEAVSLGLNGSARLSDYVLARASWGQGFKAPSLFQLHSDYGNTQLRPERSESLDAGLRYSGIMQIYVTAFRNNSSNLIDFITCPPSGAGICSGRPYGTYDNIGRARSRGVEVAGTLDVVEGLEAGLAYAFTASTNRATGLRLARRPRHAGTLTLDWQAFEPLTLGADVRVVSASFDDPANTRRLGGHALLDLRASWTVSEHFDLYGRIENAWNERYQTALGYAQQGRAAFVGVRARL